MISYHKSFLLISAIWSITAFSQDGEPFAIGCRRSGFFSNVLIALTSLAWARDTNKTPIIIWDARSSLYFNPLRKETNNVWEYYFEPVSALRYSRHYPIWRNAHAPSGSFIPHRPGQGGFNHDIRHYYHEVATQYLHIKEPIQQKINVFYNTYIAGKPTIGIHLRGTDKKIEVKPTDIMIIINAANALADKIGDSCQFFIATDESKLLSIAGKYLNRPVIYCDARRSSTHQGIHQMSIRNKDKLGEDVLIESQLLARCDYFIHTCSNVSIAVCIFNPELKNMYFDNNQLQPESLAWSDIIPL